VYPSLHPQDCTGVFLRLTLLMLPYFSTSLRTGYGRHQHYNVKRFQGQRKAKLEAGRLSEPLRFGISFK
jgi:hypothetical protein